MNILICCSSAEESYSLKNSIEEIEPGAHEFTLASYDKVCEMISARQLPCDAAVLELSHEGDASAGVNLAVEINHAAPRCALLYFSELSDYTPEIYETTHCYFIPKDRSEEFLPRALDKAARIARSGRRTVRVYEDRVSKDIRIISIRYIARRNRKVCIAADREYEVNRSISELLKELPPRFVRCHEGFAVNLDHVVSVEAGSITMKRGDSIPIGRAYKKQFFVAYAAYCVNM